MNNLLSIIADVKRRPAAAYIERVETARGSSITEIQKTAIGAFIEEEQVGGRWNAHRCLYLSIWGNAAANAICLKSLTSGAFAGTVTHGAGYVQGDGSTGYFNMGFSPVAHGLTNASAFYGALVNLAESRNAANYTLLGASNAAVNSRIASLGASAASRAWASGAESAMTSPNGMSRDGIFYCGITATNARYFRVRRTAAVQAAGSNTISDTNTPSTAAMAVMARNFSGAYTEYSNARIGASFMGLGLSVADADAFTLNLKTLWETCTGLTLP